MSFWIFIVILCPKILCVTWTLYDVIINSNIERMFSRQGTSSVIKFILIKRHHHRSMISFCAHRSQKRLKDWQFDCLFVHLGYAGVKAARSTLMKLTPGHVKLNFFSLGNDNVTYYIKKILTVNLFNYWFGDPLKQGPQTQSE